MHAVTAVFSLWLCGSSGLACAGSSQGPAIAAPVPPASTGPAAMLSICEPEEETTLPAEQRAAHTSQARFAIIGDFGEEGPGAASVAHLVASWMPQYIVTTGDNNYPGGAAETFDASEAQYYAAWMKFAPHYEGGYRHVSRFGDNRFFASLGNHDWRTPHTVGNLGPIMLPGNGRYYVVADGEIAWFIVDSDPHEPDGAAYNSVQGQWLQAALKQSTAHYKLVVFHHPPYTLGPHRSSLWMRWPFAQWGASAVFNGHNHDYERHTVDDIPYVVNGMGGANTAALPAGCRLKGASRSLCVGERYGAMRANLTEEGLAFEAVAADGAVIDAFTLTAAASAGER